MSCLVKSRRPNGTVYVYEQTSVWNSEKGYPIPKRTLIGKIDPSTGSIIPTRKQNRSKKSNNTGEEPKADTAVKEAVLKKAQDYADARTIQGTLESYQNMEQGMVTQVQETLAQTERLKANLEKELAEMQRFLLELDVAIRDMQSLIYS